jgi:hypothetical protein
MLTTDGTAYIARAVSYPPKSFVKSTSGIESIKLFAAVSWSVCLCQSLPPPILIWGMARSLPFQSLSFNLIDIFSSS